MNKRNASQDSGFIGNIILVIVSLFALSYIFGFDIIGFLNQPEVKDFFYGIFDTIGTFIENFIKEPFSDLRSFIKEMGN